MTQEELSSHKELFDKKEKEKSESYAMMLKLNKEMMAKKDQKHSEMEKRIDEHIDQLAQRDQEHEALKSTIE